MKNDKTNSEKNKVVRISNYFLLFLAISFIGWLWETLYFLVIDGELCERGFLTLTVCPIYGFSVLGVYFLLGTPNEGRGILKKVKNKHLLIWLFFILSALIPTLLELCVGWFFDYFFDLRLWRYDGNLWNFNGYISPSMSLFWGIALTLFMKFLFPKIMNLFMKIPKKTSLVISSAFLVLLLTDTAICFKKAVSKILKT